ncbi:hypothetical protein NSS71_11340 [Niallia sp. FSL W8-0951]|uniref:hypothetical protein n=1 Tax=Niallia sp. FSL W8-0951 TaxID=2954639 RepID=UPI0030FA4303
MITFLPLFSAFIGAVVAQLLAHALTSCRERKKNNKEIFQEFISPFLNEIMLFIETETRFRKEHDVEKTIDGTSLLREIFTKIKYGNSYLINAKIKYDYSISFFNGKQDTTNNHMLRVFFWFLDYSRSILKSIISSDEDLLIKIVKIQKKCGLWIILSDAFTYEIATEIMNWSWTWNKDFYEYISIEDIQNLLEVEEHENSYAIKKLIESIYKEFTNSKNEIPKEIITNFIENE